MNRARVVTLNAALGPLDYRVPDGMHVEPGSLVIAPLGPRQLIGVVWEPERLPTEEVGDNRLRNLVHVYDIPPIAAPLRRLGLLRDDEENAVLDFDTHRKKRGK